MATTVRYNNRYIYDVLTEFIEQRMDFDASGADPIINDISARFSGIVYVGTSTSNFGLYLPGSSMGAQLEAAIKDLEQAQCKFDLSISGNVVLSITGKRGPANDNSLFDIDNGPKVSVRVYQIINDKAARIEFTIQARVPICTPATSGQYRGLVHMKFWQTDDTDDAWFSTRYYRGRIRVTDPTVNVIAMSWLFMPPLIQGFKRDRITINESASGVEADFMIVDRQQYAMPPLPAVKAHIGHKVVFPTVGANFAVSELRVLLEGPPDVSKEALFALCFRIMDEKLRLGEALSGGNDFVQFLEFDDSVMKSSASGVARIQHTNIAGLMGANRTFAKPLAEGGGQFTAPRITAGLRGIFIQALTSSPCNPNVTPYGNPIQPDGSVSSDTPQTTQAKNYPPPNSPGATASIDPSQMPGGYHQDDTAYAIYYVSSRIHQDNGYLHLPLSKTGGTSSASTAETMVVQMSNRMATRKLNIESSRVGAWPVFPKNTPFTDSNQIVCTPLTYETLHNAVQTSADGKKQLHSAEIEILYAMSRAPRVDEPIPVGMVPYNTDQSVTAIMHEVGGFAYPGPGSQFRVIV